VIFLNIRHREPIYTRDLFVHIDLVQVEIMAEKEMQKFRPADAQGDEIGVLQENHLARPL